MSTPPPARARPLAPVLLAPVLLCAAALLLPACFGSSPPSRFYVLRAVPAAQAPARPTERVFVVGPVKLPPEVDRVQLVTRVGPNERAVHETARWAAPLDEHVARVLAEDIAARAGTERVGVVPVTAGEHFDLRVAVDVVAFDAGGDGACSVTARWIVYDGGGTMRVAQQTTAEARAASGDPDDLVDALSRCLGQLADAMASAMLRVTLPSGR